MAPKSRIISLDDVFNTPEARATHRAVAQFITLVKQFQKESRENPIQVGPCKPDSPYHRHGRAYTP